MIRRLFVGGVAFVGVAFLTLPTVAIFTRVPVGHLVAQLGNRAVLDALRVSAETSAVAQGLILLVGTPTALMLARRFPGRELLVALVELPLVLPPAVAGIGLFAAFGRTGLLHTSIPFTKLAVVFAVALVSGPLYVRAAIAAFESLDQNVVAASRTLGAGPAKTFFRVVLPLARPGLAAGAALALARGLGEFGATIMFAGALQGRTETLPLAVYSQFNVDFDVALAISALLVALSAALLVLLKWRPSLSTSRFRFAASS
jgi:molybdate transport system permease protein